MCPGARCGAPPRGPGGRPRLCQRVTRCVVLLRPVHAVGGRGSRGRCHGHLRPLRRTGLCRRCRRRLRCRGRLHRGTAGGGTGRHFRAQSFLPFPEQALHQLLPVLVGVVAVRRRDVGRRRAFPGVVRPPARGLVLGMALLRSGVVWSSGTGSACLLPGPSTLAGRLLCSDRLVSLLPGDLGREGRVCAVHRKVALQGQPAALVEVAYDLLLPRTLHQRGGEARCVHGGGLGGRRERPVFVGARGRRQRQRTDSPDPSGWCWERSCSTLCSSRSKWSKVIERDPVASAIASGTGALGRWEDETNSKAGPPDRCWVPTRNPTPTPAAPRARRRAARAAGPRGRNDAPHAGQARPRRAPSTPGRPPRTPRARATPSSTP